MRLDVGRWAFEVKAPSTLELLAVGGSIPLFPATVAALARGQSRGAELDLGAEAEALMRVQRVLQAGALGARRSVMDQTSWLLAGVTAVGLEELQAMRLVREARDSAPAAGRLWVGLLPRAARAAVTEAVRSSALPVGENATLERIAGEPWLSGALSEMARTPGLTAAGLLRLSVFDLNLQLLIHHHAQMRSMERVDGINAAGAPVFLTWSLR